MYHVYLLNVEEVIFRQLGFSVQNIKIEDESAEYGAAEFTAANLRFKFRTSKVTPTKVGQFVTFWKRIGTGPIMPYDVNDAFDVLLISAMTNSHFGIFIFPKSVLQEKGIISCNSKEGKRAMRIYPSWDKADNQQAKKTQAWQLQYFFDVSKEERIDETRLQELLKLR